MSYRRIAPAAVVTDAVPIHILLALVDDDIQDVYVLNAPSLEAARAIEARLREALHAG